MLATRPGALLLAVLCAACAAAVIVFALTSYKAGVKPIVTQATALVATGQIQKGTSGDLVASQKLYKSTPIVATQLAAGAVSDAAALKGKVAIADILPGQQLTTTEFSTPVSVATSLLAPNQRAISVPADQVHGDLSVIAPGDRIDVYASLSASGKIYVSLLMSDVLVLKAPSSGLPGAAAGSSAGQSSSTLVLAVNTPAIQGLEYTADHGNVWVALRPANATATLGGLATADSILAQAVASGPNTPSTSNVPITGTHP